MARRVTTQLIDDLDGESEAGETIMFGLDGEVFEIDLTDQHATKLRDQMKPWITAGRRTAGRRPGRPRGRRNDHSLSSTNYNNAEIREWCKANDIQVSRRGRLPQEIIDRFEAASK